MPFILGTNSIKDTGYDVANSVRFDDGDSAYLQKSASAGNRRTFTFSTWLKRGNLTSGSYHTFFSSDQAATNSFRVTFNDDSGSDDDKLMVYYYTGSHQLKFITNRQFRDTTNFYHIVIAVDTTQATEGNRFKMYINGTQETSFSTATYPSQNLDTSVNQSGAPTRVGAGTSLYFDGYMCETVLIDGTQYAASDFGEFDSDSPTIWKPKDVSGLTFGTNGFYLNYENAAELGTDANGGTALSETNLDAQNQSIDTCTNNHSTLNNLIYSSASKTYSEGNTAISTSDSGNWCATQNNIGVRNGKWYMEVKITGLSSFFAVGVGFNPLDSNGSNVSAFINSTYLVGEDSGTYGWRNNGALPQGGTSLSTYTTNDILMIALDMDNLKVYFGKNGTWENSGNPTSGSTGTGSMGNLTAGEDYFFIVTPRNASASVNFGSPAYSISSGNADGNGYGNFEYSVPSGYYSLNTKNLAEYG